MKRKQSHPYIVNPEALAVKERSGNFSQFVTLLLRASKLNDEQDRELANRELDLFIEKILNSERKEN